MFIVSKCLKVETTPLCVGVGLEPLNKVVSCEIDFKNKRAIEKVVLLWVCLHYFHFGCEGIRDAILSRKGIG